MFDDKCYISLAGLDSEVLGRKELHEVGFITQSSLSDTLQGKSSKRRTREQNWFISKKK